MNRRQGLQPIWQRLFLYCLARLTLAACLLSVPAAFAQTTGFSLDFEEGSLRGWQRSGNAFDFQPTRGDNPTARHRGQPSKHQGQYWIGTYERYQGKSGEKAGSVQGDAPTGTLTSPTFTLPGGTLSFLVGGGSDFSTRVELVIIKGTGEFNETRVFHASGKNNETMRRVRWNLSPHANQQARLRIVDASAGGWGHINADDFRFSASPPTAAQPPIAEMMKGIVSIIPPQSKTVSVPSVVGETAEAAQAILKQHRLQMGNLLGRPSSRPAKTVIAQKPKARTQVEPDSLVDLWLATPMVMPVPSLVGRSVDDAIAILAETALEAGDVRKEVSARKEGTVVRQQPTAGTPTERGATIDLWVAVTDLVEVPELVGTSVEAAQEKLERRRLSLGTLATVPSEEAVDTVIDQEPPGGTRVKANSRVNLWLAKQMRVTVPNLGGLTESEAETAINKARLQMGRIREKASAHKPGTVIEQSPRSGSQVAIRSAVDLLLAKPELLPVPDLIGLSMTAAEKAITRARLQVGDHKQRPSEEQTGTVVEQQPRADSRVAAGSKVAIWTASPVLVEVPDLVGLSRQAAQRTLANSRLRLGEHQEKVSEEKAGTVLRHQPDAGTRVPVNSTVNLVVAVAAEPEWVTVPSLSGMSTDQAKVTLAGTGLLLGSLKERVSSLVEGSVLDQTPAPGTAAPPSSPVNIVIAVASPVVPVVPMWAWLAGGLITVGAASITIARLRARKKPSSVAAEDLSPRVKPHPDSGSQRVLGNAPSPSGPALRLRPVQDPGTVRIIPPEPSVQHRENDHEP